MPRRAGDEAMIEYLPGVTSPVVTVVIPRSNETEPHERINVVMRKLTGAIFFCFSMLALTIAGCGGGGGGGGASNELDLGPVNFVQTSITLSTGQALHIVDPQSTGGTHMLCLGQQGACDANPSGPSELHGPGLPINPGTTKDITFSAAGTYHITCTIHPSMNLTVTVQ
jgi:hypothetical protein